MTSTAPLARPSAGRAPESPVPRALWHYLRGSDLRALVLGASKDPNAKITILLVSPEDGRPQLAVKVPTTAAAERAVHAEARLLRELGGLQLNGLLATVPRVVDLVDFEGRAALVMTAVPGIPMTTAYLEWRHTRSAARVAADFAAVSAWIGDFQRATAGGSAALDLDGGVASRLQRRFPGEPAIDADLDRLAAIYKRLRETWFREPSSTETSGAGTSSATVVASRGWSTGKLDRPPASRCEISSASRSCTPSISIGARARAAALPGIRDSWRAAGARASRTH